MKRPLKTWHPEAKRFFKQIVAEYEFSDDEQRVVVGTAQHLSTYWQAVAKIEVEGLTIQGQNGLTRKHPASEIAKNSWAAFLAGCRLLGVCQPHEEKRPVGRPGSGI